MISNYLQSNHLIPNSNQKMNDSKMNLDKSNPPPAPTNDLSNNSLKKKNIPIELTAYGTTPSGKPRLFVCQACTRAFARLEHLRRHERSHTKEKPFSCGVCQRKFSRRDLLLRHAQKLHAGCSDAITRLRRKSIKRTSGDDDDSENLNQNLDDDVVMTESPNTQSASPQNHQQNVEFNLDLFSKNNEAKIVKPKKSNSTSSSSSNSITRKNSLLQRQLFQTKKKPSISTTPNRKKRGTSFSAQSGANYAMVPDYHDNYPNPENVGFSTPQLHATSMNDEISWLNNLSTIPGMLSDKSFSTNDNHNNHNNNHNNNNNNNNNNHNNNNHNNNNTTTINQHKRSSLSDLRQNSLSSYTDGSLSHKPSLINDISNPGSFSLSHDQSLNPSFNNLSYMLPTATMANHEFQKGIKENNRKDKVDFGYSFYDIPETMLTGKSFDSVTKDMDHVNTNNNHFNDNNLREVHQQFKALAPIKQEDDENGFPDNHPPSQTSNQNYDLNFLNDIDKLTHEFDVNSKFMPNGYSFYGDNPSVASSGIEVNSPHIFSPQVPMNPNGNMVNQQQSQQPHDSTVMGLNLDQNQLIHLENCISHSELDFSNVPNPTNNFNFNIGNNNQDHESIMKSKSHNSGNYFRNKLFTNNMRHMINKSLGKYPISGIMSPSIPSNEKLELYLTTFIQVFLTHFPFIHNSKLNEYDIMNMTSNEDPNNESARVCLPLLIATMGALLANNKNDSEHLYEASRRTIHIYLESRKNSMNNDDKKEKSTVNPLWLIQSLTLSVIYGLFSDNENNVYIVIRQLNALNSLVKTSIKSNRRILFSINGEDEEIFSKLNPDGIIGNTDALLGSSLFSNSFNDELKFKNTINIQSQTRIVFMIYRLTNFLLMMYNVPLTLSINDLQNIALPNQDDELLWSFKNYQDFQEYCQFTNNNIGQGQIPISLDDKLNGDRIVYKDLLFNLTKMNDPNQIIDQKLINSQLVQLSKVGFISLVHGIYEIQQYEDMKYFDVHGLLDYITKFIPATSMNYETHKHYNHHQQTQLQSNQRHEIPHDYEKLDFAMLTNYIKINSLINFKLVKEQSWLRNYDELSKNFNIFLIEHNPNNPTNKLDDYSYLKVVDCCIMIIKLILFKSEDNIDGPTLNKTNLINLEYTKSEHNEENTLETFEKDIHVRIFDELDNSHNSIHSQMLFHVFTILSLFSIYVLKKNNPNYSNLSDNSADGLFELNRRFSMVLKLLEKIESFLKVKYNSNGSSKLEQDFTNLYLFGANSDTKNSSTTNGASTSELLDNISGVGDNNMSYSLEKTLYILKVGECVLNYLYDTNVKISIYKKLSGSMLHIRKFLIDNESRILS